MSDSVENVVKALEALAGAQRALTVSEVAVAVGLSRQATADLLASLTQQGYASANPAGKRFSATSKLWEIGSRVDAGDDLPRVASPYVRKLAAQSDFTVQLAVFEAGYAVYIDQIYGKNPIKSIVLGTRSPATTVSAGKAMLAWLGDKQFDQAMKLVKAFTPLTKLEPAEVKRDLEETRVRGYAINHGEFRKGVGGVAAPLFGRRNGVVGSVSFCPHNVQLVLSADAKPLIAALIDAAATMSRALGSTREILD